MKSCSKCNVTKPDSEFHKNGTRLASRCRHCTSLRRKGTQRGMHGHAVRDPIKLRAQGAVRDAVRYGRLMKPGLCEECHQPTRPSDLHGHHHCGYEQRLNVKWICRRCHASEHAAYL